MKRKQILARAITLGLLLAMPVGGAMAAELTIDSSNTGNLGAEWNTVDEGYYIYNTGSLTNNTITIDGVEVKGNGWTVYGKRYNNDGISDNYVEDGYCNTEYYVDENKKGEGTNIYGAYAKNDNTIAVSGNQVIMNGGSTISEKVEKDIVRVEEYFDYYGTEEKAYTDTPQTIFNTGSIIGGQSDGTGEVSGNTVTINDGNVANSAIGGQSNGTGTVSGNQVILTNGTVNGQHALLGGYATLDSDVTGNKVTMSGGTVNGSIKGGYAFSSKYHTTGDVTKNSVIITGGTINGGGNIRGGESQTGAASENSVSIENATINGNNQNYIYGGYSVSGAANKNTVSISNMENLDANVSGGRTNGNAEASYNKVILTNVTFNSAEHPNRTSFSAGGGSSASGTAEENEVEVTNVKMNKGGLTGGSGNVANNNKVTVSGADTQINLVSGSAGSMIMGGSGKTQATGNIVTIEGGEITGNAASMIVAGRVTDSSSYVNSTAEGNTVQINNGTVGVDIYGGWGQYGSAMKNDVVINGGTISSKQIIGGMVQRDGAITGNSITISGGDFIASTEVIGGLTNKDYKDEVNINQNTITVTETAKDLKNVSLYGAKTDSANAQLSDNALVIDGWRGTVNTIGGVTDLNFENVDLSGEGGVLSAAQNTNLTGVKISVNSLKDGSDLKADEEYTIIDGKNITLGNVSDTQFESVDTSGNGVRVHGVSATTSENNLVANITKSVLANVYVDENGEETSNELAIGEGFATNASVVAGAYASGENKAEGGSVIIKGAYDGDVYAGYSESGEVGANTITLQGGADAGALYGSNTGVSAAGLIVDGGDSKAKSVNNFATVDLGEKEQALTIGEMNGEATTFIVHDVQKNGVRIAQNNVQEVVVHGTSHVADGLNPDDMQQSLQEVIDVIDVENGNKQKLADIDPGKIMGRVQALSDENGNIVGYKEDVNPANEGISEMASIALMTWRQENNDMNKRLGELRDSAGEHGVWVRMTRGEAKYGNQNIKNQYNAYQLGYDEKLSSDKHWTVGAALTYTDAESSFSYGKGENKHKGLALYGSRLNDDGSFIDLIARYARLEHEYEVYGGAGKGDFDTNGYSLSAEYGKRFTQDNGLWIEPQVELTYGKVSSGSYVTNNGVRVQQDGMDSLVGRLGFALGKNLAKGKGNVYLRASYLYDFDGETDVRYSYGRQNKRFEQDLGGGWWEVGIGTNINLSEASHLYFDVEKTYGGDVATPWQWNAGVRWSF